MGDKDIQLLILASTQLGPRGCYGSPRPLEHVRRRRCDLFRKETVLTLSELCMLRVPFEADRNAPRHI